MAVSSSFEVSCRREAKSAKGSPRFLKEISMAGSLAVLRVLAVSSSLVRSPARLPRWPGAGWWRVRAFPLVRIRVSGSSSRCFPPGWTAMAPSSRRVRQEIFLKSLAAFACFASSAVNSAPGSARDATPSFQGIEMSSESPLNIRTGSHPERKGTRLSGRIRDTGRSGLVELCIGQRASGAGLDAMLPPGHGGPALVKSCERYRCDRQGSILPIPMHGMASP